MYLTELGNPWLVRDDGDGEDTMVLVQGSRDHATIGVGRGALREGGREYGVD